MAQLRSLSLCNDQRRDRKTEQCHVGKSHKAEHQHGAQGPPCFISLRDGCDVHKNEKNSKRYVDIPKGLARAGNWFTKIGPSPPLVFYVLVVQRPVRDRKRQDGRAPRVQGKLKTNAVPGGKHCTAMVKVHVLQGPAPTPLPRSVSDDHTVVVGIAGFPRRLFHRIHFNQEQNLIKKN